MDDVKNSLLCFFKTRSNEKLILFLSSERKLYWCDARTERIERSSLNGGDRELLINLATGAHPYGIAVFRENIFWTDWHHTSLMRADKLTGNHKVMIGSASLGRPNSLQIYSSDVGIEGMKSLLHHRLTLLPSCLA